MVFVGLLVYLKWNNGVKLTASHIFPFWKLDWILLLNWNFKWFHFGPEVKLILFIWNLNVFENRQSLCTANAYLSIHTFVECLFHAMRLYFITEIGIDHSLPTFFGINCFIKFVWETPNVELKFHLSASINQVNYGQTQQWLNQWNAL